MANTDLRRCLRAVETKIEVRSLVVSKRHRIAYKGYGVRGDRRPCQKVDSSFDDEFASWRTSNFKLNGPTLEPLNGLQAQRLRRRNRSVGPLGKTSSLCVHKIHDAVG